MPKYKMNLIVTGRFIRSIPIEVEAETEDSAWDVTPIRPDWNDPRWSTVFEERGCHLDDPREWRTILEATSHYVEERDGAMSIIPRYDGAPIYTSDPDEILQMKAIITAMQGGPDATIAALVKLFGPR